MPPLSPSPALVADTTRRLRLFATGTDGVLYQLGQVQPNDGWSAWLSLGTPGPALRTVPPTATLVNLIDRSGLSVLALGSDLAVYRRQQLLPDDPWSAWQSLGGSLDSAAGVLSAGGITYLFGVDTLGVLEENSDVTGGWAAHPGSPTLNGQPAVAPSTDGRLEVFAVTTSGMLAHQWQLGGGGWSSSLSSSHHVQVRTALTIRAELACVLVDREC